MYTQTRARAHTHTQASAETLALQPPTDNASFDSLQLNLMAS